VKAYLDSSAVLDILDPKSVRHASATLALATEPRTWCVSDLVRLECLVRPLRHRNSDAESEVREVLRKMECLVIVPSAYGPARVGALTNCNGISPLNSTRRKSIFSKRVRFFAHIIAILSAKDE
jgi:hypothetical protein